MWCWRQLCCCRGTYADVHMNYNTFDLMLKTRMLSSGGQVGLEWWKSGRLLSLARRVRPTPSFLGLHCSLCHRHISGKKWRGKGNKSGKLVLVFAFSLPEKFVCLWVRRSLIRTASYVLTRPVHTGQKHLTNILLIVPHCLLCHFVAKLNTTLRRQAAVLGLVKKKRRRWKISMFAKSKFLHKVRHQIISIKEFWFCQISV